VPAAPSHDVASPEEIERGRLVAAIAYLPVLGIIGLLGMPENRYVGFHARQGLLLFLVELVIWAVLAIVHGTIGRIPILGFLIVVLLDFACWMALLAATVYGVIKGASGEMTRLPVLGDYVERLPF
jgi:uncharacterized membrane protein